MQWVDTSPALLKEAAEVDLRAGDAVIVLDRVGRCVGVEPGDVPIVGLEPEQLLGRSGVDARWRWCEPDGRPIGEPDTPVARALASGRAVPTQVLGLEPTDTPGAFAWVEVTAYPLRAQDGSVDGVATAMRDVSQTPQGRAATASLARSLRTLASLTLQDEIRFRTLAENSADVLLETDVVGRCVWVSPSVTEVLGLEPSEVLGRTLAHLMHPADREVANERRQAALAGAGGGHDRLDLRYATGDGGWRWMSVLSRPLRDATGRVVGAVTALHDIQAEVERREEEHYRPGRDSLTGLLTHDSGRRALRKALLAARGGERSVGVLLVDVDGLGRLNAEHGTPAGDAAIRHVADVLVGHLRESDSVARYGPDEFLVVLTSVAAPDHATARAQGLLELVQAPRGGGEPGVRVSIGVAVDDGGGDVDAVLARADLALRAARSAGGGRVAS